MERNTIDNREKAFNERQEASKKKVMHFCIFGTVLSVIGIFLLNYYAIQLISKQKDLGTSLTIAVTAGVLLLGCILLGFAVSCFAIAHKEWHNNCIRIDDIKYLLPKIKEYLENSRIEESRLVTTNELTMN